MECKNVTSIIVICDSTIRAIYNVRNDILRTINSVKTVKKQSVYWKTEFVTKWNVKPSSIHNTNYIIPIHDGKFDTCDKFKTPLWKWKMINRISSKSKLYTSLANIDETTKTKNVCINSNVNADIKNQDELQLNSGK